MIDPAADAQITAALDQQWAEMVAWYAAMAPAERGNVMMLLRHAGPGHPAMSDAYTWKVVRGLALAALIETGQRWRHRAEDLNPATDGDHPPKEDPRDHRP